MLSKLADHGGTRTSLHGQQADIMLRRFFSLLLVAVVAASVSATSSATPTSSAPESPVTATNSAEAGATNSAATPSVISFSPSVVTLNNPTEADWTMRPGGSTSVSIN